MSPLGFAACQSKKCTNIKSSHRFHRFSQKFIAEKRLPQNSRNTQKFIAEKKLPQNTQNSQKFIAEKRLPQNSQIYTDVSKMFCVFREICGSLRLRGRSLLLKRKLPRNSRNTQKFIAEKKTPTDFTDLHRCKQIVL